MYYGIKETLSVSGPSHVESYPRSTFLTPYVMHVVVFLLCHPHTHTYYPAIVNPIGPSQV